MNSSLETFKILTSTATRSGKNPPSYMPIYVLTGVFGALFIVGPFFIPKGPNKPLFRWCVMITTFCMWIFWVTVYIAQMNPLLGPRMENTTLAWMIHSDKTSSPPEETWYYERSNNKIEDSVPNAIGKGRRVVRDYLDIQDDQNLSTTVVLNNSNHIDSKLTRSEPEKLIRTVNKTQVTNVDKIEKSLPN